MTDGEKPQFVQAVAGMAATLNRSVGEAWFEGYWRGLRDLPLEAIDRAVDRAIRECKFLPTVYELRELAGELSPDTRAVMAWAVFDKAVRQHGYYESVTFDDPVINATVRNLGGWEAVGCIDDAKEFDVWLRKRFLETYAALMRGGVSPEQAMPLVGCFERENRLHGHGDYEDKKGITMIATGLPPHSDPRLLPAPGPVQKLLPQPELLEGIGTMPGDGA